MKKYIVVMQCKVTKKLVVEAESLEKTETDPYNCNVLSEEEIDEWDWEVLEVREIKG